MSEINEHLGRVDAIASGVVAKHAVEVDRTGNLPEATIQALAEAGLVGLISATSVGGAGLGLRAATLTVERLARECASTAMVMCMHYSAAIVVEQLGSEAVRREIASGKHLTTLAFSEAGSRSQFWAPLGTAAEKNGRIVLNARKSWVTSAHHAQSYVWSSKPLAAEGASTIWLVPSKATGLRVADRFDGLGLRGNDSCPVTAEGLEIDRSQMLGEDGQGLKVMLEIVLPWFNLMNAGCSVGLMETATAKSIAHATDTRFEHTASAISDLPTIRATLARMRVKTDMARSLLLDSLDAIEKGRPDAVLRVLEVKAAANDAAAEVVDLAMRVCGGAAFRKEVGVERVFRDARAGMVMAPTSDALYEFIGRAVCNMPVFG
jgi:alkylation response protein AidB-like acyl-CoA dehydrogenase